MSLTATASGMPAPTVQWKLSTDGGSTYNNLSGATSATYSFTALSSMTGYKYEAVFTNATGSATSTAATLTVNALPVVTTQPQSISVVAGATATLTAAGSGTPSPTVQWQTDTGTGGVTWTNVAGATSTTLSLTGTTAGQNGYQYRAVFTNSCGSVNSSAAILTVTSGTLYGLSVADASNRTTNVRGLQAATLSGTEYAFTSPNGSTASNPSGIANACFYLDGNQGTTTTNSTLFPSNSVPAIVDSGDIISTLELGVQFSSSVAGLSLHRT